LLRGPTIDTPEHNAARLAAAGFPLPFPNLEADRPHRSTRPAPTPPGRTTPRRPSQ
jgi:hypothetical protein